MEGGVKMLALERSSVEGETTFRWAYAQKFCFGLYCLNYPMNDTPQFFLVSFVPSTQDVPNKSSLPGAQIFLGSCQDLPTSSQEDPGDIGTSISYDI